MDDKFVNYLKSEIEKRNLTVTDLAKKTGLTRAAIYNVFNGDKKPGVKFCLRVSRAFEVAPEEVLREAGLLPELPDMDISEAIEVIHKLDRDEYKRVTEYARWRLKEQRGKYNLSG